MNYVPCLAKSPPPFQLYKDAEVQYILGKVADISCVEYEVKLIKHSIDNSLSNFKKGTNFDGRTMEACHQIISHRTKFAPEALPITIKDFEDLIIACGNRNLEAIKESDKCNLHLCQLTHHLLQRRAQRNYHNVKNNIEKAKESFPESIRAHL